MSYATFSTMAVGMIAMMCLYMFCRSFLSSDNAYRYYAGYLFFFLLYFLLSTFDKDIIAFFGMPPKEPRGEIGYYTCLRIFISTWTALFYLLFVSDFLALKSLVPKVYQLFRWSIKILWACCIMGFMLIFTPPLRIYLEIGHLIVVLCLIGVSFYAIGKTALLKNRLANFFVYGNSLYVFFVTLSFYSSNFPVLWIANTGNNSVPFYQTSFTYTYLAVIFETLFFAVGLSYKTHLVEVEKRQLQENYNQELVIKVNERTAEIVELKEQQFAFANKQALNYERTRLARDMHDDISSGLSAINL
jgi:signal transduction histidine kinase